MGYTDPNTNIGNKDPFGINVRSGFGNYAEYAGKQVTNLNEALAESAAKRGLTWDANTGTIVGADEDDKAYQDFMSKTRGIQERLGHYGQVDQNFNTLKHNYAVAKKQRDAWEKETYRELDDADKRFKDTGDYDEYSGTGGTWSGPVGPHFGHKDYADPSTDAEENQPNNNQGGQGGVKDSSGVTGGYSYDSGGRQGYGYGLKNGGLISIL